MTLVSSVAISKGIENNVYRCRGSRTSWFVCRLVRSMLLSKAEESQHGYSMIARGFINTAVSAEKFPLITHIGMSRYLEN